MAHLLPNPGQLVLDFLGRVAGRAQHAKASSAANGRHNRWVMGKAKHGLSNAQPFTQAGLQSIAERH
jgi:hypothetical protein